MDVREVDLAQLEVFSENSRKDLDAGNEDSSIAALAASIREMGLLSPLTVRPIGAGRCEVVAGQRRFMACQSLGMQKIPVIVQDLGDREASAVSLIENVHRADLHPLDKAKAFANLAQYYGNDIGRVSGETGVSTATIRKYLSMLTLPESIQNSLSTSQGPANVEMLHQLARAYPDPQEAEQVYSRIKGFTQQDQVRIIKESGGDVGNIDHQVNRALEGEFTLKICKGIDNCQYIPQTVRAQVRVLVQSASTESQRPTV